MPTVAEILRLDAVQRGEPQVVAAAGRVDVPVRWVHVIELPDAARLLRGGELVLTTGIALPDEGPLLAGYVAAAEQHGLPLIVFQREVRFIEITEAVHAQIIDDQLGQLRASAQVHEVFTDLAVAGAAPGEVLRQ